MAEWYGQYWYNHGTQSINKIPWSQVPYKMKTCSKWKSLVVYWDSTQADFTAEMNKFNNHGMIHLPLILCFMKHWMNIMYYHVVNNRGHNLKYFCAHIWTHKCECIYTLKHNLTRYTEVTVLLDDSTPYLF